MPVYRVATYEEELPLTEQTDDESTLYESSASSDSLPYPTATPTSTAKTTATSLVPVWIALSAAVTVYNNHIFNFFSFRFPVFLVACHLVFTSIGTRVLQCTTRLLDGTKDVPMNRYLFTKDILPIGILYSGSLILSNMSYFHFSVYYIQMFKGLTPIGVLLISIATGVQHFHCHLSIIIGIVTCGIVLASLGELFSFEVFGCFIQMAAVVCEASRLVMTQKLLQRTGMDPLVALHYFAPVCAVISLAVLPFTDGLEPFRQLPSLGPFIIISNAFIALLLNIASIFLISVGSGLIHALSGILKDVVIVVVSTFVLDARVAPIQAVGYSVALTGLILFKMHDDREVPLQPLALCVDMFKRTYTV